MHADSVLESQVAMAHQSGIDLIESTESDKLPGFAATEFDIAFLANHGGGITVTDMTVNATVEGTLPMDDIRQPAAIH